MSNVADPRKFLENCAEILAHVARDAIDQTKLKPHQLLCMWVDVADPEWVEFAESFVAKSVLDAKRAQGGVSFVTLEMDREKFLLGLEPGMPTLVAEMRSTPPSPGMVQILVCAFGGMRLIEVEPALAPN